MAAFQAFFYVVPALMIALAVFALTGIARRAQDVSRAWSSGYTSQARCLRAYTTTSGGGDTGVRTTLHHVYEFATFDARVIRFDEANGPATTVEGDMVTVHYLPDRPERATAHAPARGRLAAGTGCAAVFLGVVIVFCLVFMVIAHLMFTVV
ncbi:DUF3592 domain-containing protein [Streptomyces coeruleofuscus]|uniref:DUF3592 domain-containing protein n=1 Tax=Streptomyces coeruleofuscus TaxID=66879 RepID=A0ABP5WA19_9ACTN